ncbi:acyl-CoA dehydrogenase [Actibacterium sp. MT2.3-13A]|uniref:acyl-CoA dehydrogenase family protein n=1 Tax=Actibacterium sp. MT2.3-13A TaxID=2828332 RepID=UPI001BAD9DB2|nr:acyl-CoA dehydrogenase [Actibacterium sp. MT2.3-13A]
MNFDLTEERQMLQDGLRRYLRDTVSPELLARATESEAGHSGALWAGLAEMGVIGALFPEEVGGFGGAGFDLALVFEEMGRAGAFEPLLETGVLAGGLIAEMGDDAQKALIEEIIAGAVQIAFAHAEPGSRYDLERVATSAEPGPEGYVLNGRKAVVAAAPSAQHFVVSARTGGAMADEDGISLFLVSAGVAGLSLRAYPVNGGGRAAEMTLENVALPRDALLGARGAAFPAIERAAARATAAVSAEALGLMEAIRALTTSYLRTRQQFGRPIGKFQALQHRMADMLIEIEQARSAVINLAGHLDAERTERERHVSATKNLIGRVARLVVEESIQMHGGIGMTQEYALAHLAKRLTMVDHRFGDADYHLERFIRLSAA